MYIARILFWPLARCSEVKVEVRIWFWVGRPSVVVVTLDVPSSDPVLQLHPVEGYRGADCHERTGVVEDLGRGCGGCASCVVVSGEVLVQTCSCGNIQLWV